MCRDRPLDLQYRHLCSIAQIYAMYRKLELYTYRKNIDRNNIEQIWYIYLEVLGLLGVQVSIGRKDLRHALFVAVVNHWQNF